MILVLGRNGQIASELLQLNPKFKSLSSKDLDLSNTDKIYDRLSQEAPSVIINCAAYTQVDLAEDERELSTAVNATALREISKYCKDNNCYLVHFSTDYVFSNKSTPYEEDDKCDPINHYGASKLEGENYVLESGCNASIIRTAWVYNKSGKNFVNTMLRLGKERDQLTVVNDQIGSPTNAKDIAQFVLASLGKMKSISGAHIYNFSNEGICSWYDFAIEIFNNANINVDIQPVDSTAFKTKAKRPKYSVLSKQKVKDVFSYEIRDWKEALKEIF